MSVADRLGGLDRIGVSSDGVSRLAWTPEDAACRAWFERQGAEVGLRTARDPAGNLWACPGAEPPWWGVGSHLDSVSGGGRFDGPLGVACGFEIAASSPVPMAVISFADEEGARFNTPTFGSKALAGRLDLPGVLGRRDRDGLSLAEAMRAFGVDSDGLAAAPAWLERLSGFIEIHIDQSTDVARADAPVGVVSSLANRLRLEVVVHGRADHAGTTPSGERQDALLGAARLVVGADEIAADIGELTVTTSRMIVEPNAPTTIASRVRLWIDARSADDQRLDQWLARIRSVEVGAKFDFDVASRSAGRSFSRSLLNRLASAGTAVLGRSVPEVVCFAGHDAGVIAERVPAAMVLVRNRSGVSHSPAEEVELEDAAVAVAVVLRALESAS